MAVTNRFYEQNLSPRNSGNLTLILCYGSWMPAGNVFLEYDLAYKIFYLFGVKKKNDMGLKEEDVTKNFEIDEM